MKKIALFLLLFIVVFVQLSWNSHKKPSREFYQLTVYHFSSPQQQKMLDAYFQNALLPALHRMGTAHVGVFKSWANDTATDKLMYVLVPANSLEAINNISEQLKKDEQYISTASDFINADYKNPPFTRIETIWLHAFPLAPQLQLPSLKGDKKNRVYELRSYESPTPQKFESKVRMFNEGGEIALFKKLQFNGIFYSEVIAGSKMPNLMYMTSFENKPDREEHWKTFGNDPEWKKLSAMPEYQNNVSHIDMHFLYPADYSDF